MNGRDLNRAPVIEGMQAVPEENGFGSSHEMSPKPKQTTKQSNEMNESASLGISNHVSVTSLSTLRVEDDATPKSSRLESAGNGYF